MAVVTGEMVQVVCPRCLASESVPLTVPAAGVPAGSVRVDAAEVERQMQRLLVIAQEMCAAYERVAAELQEARAQWDAAVAIEHAFRR